jgi:radical SAM superfamily enzyme YgiQ (UPF0313 family)
MRALFILKPFFIEPLGPMYLIAAAKKAGFTADLVTTDEDLDIAIEAFKPDILCYSIMTGDLHKQLHEKHGIDGLAGGPHPTFFPRCIEYLSFQYICGGEGEEAFVEFLQNGMAENALPRNFATHAALFERRVPCLRSLTKDLDTIAFPDRACVFKYRDIYSGPIKHFIAGRGCPFDCTYCFNAAYSELYKGKGSRVRFRSPANLLEEIEEVVGTSPVELVYFQDDTFILNKSWLAEFLTMYKEVELPFHCHVRANLVDDIVAKTLAEANCRSVHLGIESGNPEVRAKVLGRRMSNDMIIEAAECLKNHGVMIMTQNILGLPFTTLDDDIATLELNKQCSPTYAWASIFQPYPKTKLGEAAKDAGLYTGDFSDLGSSFFDKSPLKIPHAKEVAALQKLFAVAVDMNFHEDTVRQLIVEPGYATNPEVVERYKQFRKMKDRELYGVDL